MHKIIYICFLFICNVVICYFCCSGCCINGQNACIQIIKDNFIWYLFGKEYAGDVVLPKNKEVVLIIKILTDCTHSYNINEQ